MAQKVTNKPKEPKYPYRKAGITLFILTAVLAVLGTVLYFTSEDSLGAAGVAWAPAIICLWGALALTWSDGKYSDTGNSGPL